MLRASLLWVFFSNGWRSSIAKFYWIKIRERETKEGGNNAWTSLGWVQLKKFITQGTTTPNATTKAHVMSQWALNIITTIAKC